MSDRTPPPVGEWVEVEPGRRLHAVCEGPTNAPGVVFCHGALGAFADGWWLQRELRNTCRVVLYTRAGMGRSDPAPQGVRPTPTWHAADLHSLLHALGMVGPIILVAHSLGGLVLQAFCATHPDELAGLVLLDAVSAPLRRHEQALIAALPTLLRAGATAADVGVNPARFVGRDDIGLPPAIVAEKDHYLASSAHWRAAAREAGCLDLDAPAFACPPPAHVQAASFSIAPGGAWITNLARRVRATARLGELTILTEASHTSLLNAQGARVVGGVVARMRSFAAATD